MSTVTNIALVILIVGCTTVVSHCELTYYPVYEPGTRLLEPGYPDSVVFYFFFLNSCLLK